MNCDGKCDETEILKMVGMDTEAKIKAATLKAIAIKESADEIKTTATTLNRIHELLGNIRVIQNEKCTVEDRLAVLSYIAVFLPQFAATEEFAAIYATVTSPTFVVPQAVTNGLIHLSLEYTRNAAILNEKREKMLNEMSPGETMVYSLIYNGAKVLRVELAKQPADTAKQQPPATAAESCKTD